MQRGTALNILGRWIAIAIGAFIALSMLVGLFPQLFFFFYAGAAALGLFGIALFILPASMVGPGAFRRGLILLFISPLMLIHAFIVQSIYGAIREGETPSILPRGLSEAFGSERFLDLPLGAWLLLGLVAINVVSVGRGLRLRQIVALNIWTVAAGLFLAYALTNR